MCTNPIPLRVDRRILRVPCGKCYDCCNYKSTRNAVLAQLEAAHHKYVLFVNPTYDMDHVPVARVEYVRSGKDVDMRVYNDSVRMDRDYEDTDQLIYQQKLTYYEYKKTQKLFQENKFRYFGKDRFPYTNTKELQRFVKRLRYYIYTDKDIPYEDRQSVRYFGAFEYGPQSFRPHFHILLYTNSDAIFSKAGYYIRKAWTYGRCPWSLSRGECAQYAAEYTTANSILPPLLKHAAVKPRCLHSIGLGREKEQICNSPIEEFRYEKIANRMFANGDGLEYISPSFSVESGLFPKCFRYAKATHIQRFNCYTLLSTAKRIYGPEKRIEDYARLFAFGRRFLSVPDLHALAWMYEPSPDGRTSTEQTFASILNMSSLFLRNCDLLELAPEAYLTSIEQYYIDKEKTMLNKWFMTREQRDLPPDQVIYDYDNLDYNNEMVEYFNSQGREPIPFFPEFFPEALCYLATTSGYRRPWFMLRAWRDGFDDENNIVLTQKKAQAYNLARRRLKHKLLNDANHIYEY